MSVSVKQPLNTTDIKKRKYVLTNNRFNRAHKQSYRDEFIEYIHKDYLLESLADDINEYISFKSNSKYLSINIKKFNILDCALKHYTLINPIPDEFNTNAFKTYLYNAAQKEYRDLQKYFKQSDNLDTLLTNLLNSCDMRLQIIIYPKSQHYNTLLYQMHQQNQSASDQDESSNNNSRNESSDSI